MRIRDLDEWPPQLAGSYRRSYEAPTSEQAIIEKVFPAPDNWVCFTCSFMGQMHSYDYEAKDRKAALELRKTLESRIGDSLFSIGELELQEE
jgi:hypothetical protein